MKDVITEFNDLVTKHNEASVVTECKTHNGMHNLKVIIKKKAEGEIILPAEFSSACSIENESGMITCVFEHSSVLLIVCYWEAFKFLKCVLETKPKNSPPSDFEWLEEKRQAGINSNTYSQMVNRIDDRRLCSKCGQVMDDCWENNYNKILMDLKIDSSSYNVLFGRQYADTHITGSNHPAIRPTSNAQNIYLEIGKERDYRLCFSCHYDFVRLIGDFISTDLYKK